MLIINADDFGKTVQTTDNIVISFREARITSTSAMVFMEDSERAASAALKNKLEVGLHVNFDEQFNGKVPAGPLREYQCRVARFLTKSRFSQLIFNPFLRKQFEYVYKAQYEEFVRLYRRPPSHVNGHHHMHLCSNVLFGNMIPNGQKVRRSFTFVKGERHIANRLYRRLVDSVVKKRFVSTDMFFAVTASEPLEKLRKKVQLAKDHNVELMVHVSSEEDLRHIMQQDFIDAVGGVIRGTYRDL